MGCAKFPFTIFLVTIVQSLVSSVIIHKSNAPRYEPMVAFLCNKPAMVRVPDGWMHDSSQNCTNDVEEILNFCKKKYPNHNINNVVPSHTPVTIDNWCKFGTEHCHRHNNHTVKPYRCLSGLFQSSALLVPEHCMFDHYHNTHVCANEQHWNQTAKERCEAKGLVKQSYDILLPCHHTDEFMGVEYVCCPTPLQPHLTIEVHVEHPHVPPKIAHPNQEVQPKPTVDADNRAYFRYLHETMNNEKEEHENFEIARRDWQRYHHSKITEMMKDWSAARDRVVQLKATDPKRAESLQTEIGQKFQKMYHALEEDGLAEKEQLNTIHQNHVQRKFNENKRVTMQKFMDELQREKPEESKLLQTLERYIRVEEKDRRHSVNHYEHVRDINPTAAKLIKSATIDHLRWIDKRILQSIKMLHRFPAIERRIQPEIDRFLRRFNGIAASAKMITSPEVVDEQRKVVEKYRIHTTDVKDDGGTAKDTKVDVVKPVEKVDVVKPVEVDEIMEKHGKGGIVEPKVEKKVEAFDSETMENEHKYTDDEKTGFVAHQTDSRMHQDEHPVHKQSVESGGVYGATVGIAIGSVSVFVVIVVAMVMLKKKARKPTITHGFVEVDQAVSPEERHVANMQINGYENPTYKYFEK